MAIRFVELYYDEILESTNSQEAAINFAGELFECGTMKKLVAVVRNLQGEILFQKQNICSENNVCSEEQNRNIFMIEMGAI